MKKRTKISLVLSSAAAILLAGSIMAGGTYALFTSESKTNIAVNSGKVNVLATVSNLWVYSPTSISMEEGNPIKDDNNAATMNEDEVSGKFYNGGTATLNSSEGTVTLDKMTPGDKVTFKLDIQNKSNVKTKYRMSIKKVDPTDSNLFSALDINIGGMSPDYYTKWQVLDIPSVEGESIKNYNCTIELPTTISGEEYMDKTCTIQILVEAVQFNAATSDADASETTSKTVEYGSSEKANETKIYNGDTEDSSIIEAVIPANSISDSVTSLTLIKTPTEVPGNIEIETGTNAISTDVKIIDQDGNKVVAQNDKYFTITVQIDKDLDLVTFYHNEKKLTSTASLGGLNKTGLYYYDKSSGKVTFTTEDFSVFTATYKFSGGLGTESAPYLIKDSKDFCAISNEYNKGKYTYYKVVDGVKEIDLSSVEKVNIHGVFYGNGTTLISNKCIFNTAGYYDEENNTFASEGTILKNFNVDFTNSSQALVFQVGASSLTYDNIKVSGHIERAQHAAAFLNYGTGNLNENETNYGADFTLNFINCSIDAEILATAEGSVASLVGYPYQGSHKAVIKVDGATNTALNSVKQYARGTTRGYKYYGMGSATVYVDEVLTTDNSFTATAIDEKNPLKNSDNRYAITPVSGATSVKFQLGTQLTAYTDELVKIPGLAGITNSAGDVYEYNINGSEDVVFNAIPLEIKSISIVNNLTDSNKPEWQFDSSTGALTITTNSTDNYIDGSVTVYAKQYNEQGTLLTTGSLQIAHRNGALSTDSWVIN